VLELLGLSDASFYSLSMTPTVLAGERVCGARRFAPFFALVPAAVCMSTFHVFKTVYDSCTADPPYNTK
jgi:hypothetical protein